LHIGWIRATKPQPIVLNRPIFLSCFFKGE